MRASGDCEGGVASANSEERRAMIAMRTDRAVMPNGKHGYTQKAERERERPRRMSERIERNICTEQPPAHPAACCPLFPPPPRICRRTCSDFLSSCIPRHSHRSLRRHTSATRRSRRLGAHQKAFLWKQRNSTGGEFDASLTDGSILCWRCCISRPINLDLERLKQFWIAQLMGPSSPICVH